MFVSGVADQLQTNYASDLRHILKCVFECNASEPFFTIEDNTPPEQGSNEQNEVTEDRDSNSSLEDQDDQPAQNLPPVGSSRSQRSRAFEGMYGFTC